MIEILAALALLTLLSIAHSLKRIILILKCYRVTVDITGLGEAPDPERSPQPLREGKVVTFRPRG